MGRGRTQGVPFIVFQSMAAVTEWPGGCMHTVQ